MQIVQSRITARIRHYAEGSNPFTSAEIDGTKSDEQILLEHTEIGARTEYIAIERYVRTTVDVDGNVTSVVSGAINTPRQYKVDRFPDRTIRHGAIEVPTHAMYKGVLRLITHPIARRMTAA